MWWIAAVVVASGYVIGAVVLRAVLRDLRRIHPHLWTGFGEPTPWQRRAWIAFACGGWPVIVVALAWWGSQARAQMRSVLRRDLRRRRSDSSFGFETEFEAEN